MWSCRHVATCRHVGNIDLAESIQVRADAYRRRWRASCTGRRSTVLVTMAADRCVVAGTPVARRPRPRADANAQACIPGTRATPSTIALIAILSTQMMVEFGVATESELDLTGI